MKNRIMFMRAANEIICNGDDDWLKTICPAFHQLEIAKAFYCTSNWLHLKPICDDILERLKEIVIYSHANYKLLCDPSHYAEVFIHE